MVNIRERKEEAVSTVDSSRPDQDRIWRPRKVDVVYRRTLRRIQNEDMSSKGSKKESKRMKDEMYYSEHSRTPICQISQYPGKCNAPRQNPMATTHTLLDHCISELDHMVASLKDSCSVMNRSLHGAA